MGKWGDCLKNNALKLSIHSRSRHFRSLELISEVMRSFPSLQAHFRGCVTPVDLPFEMLDSDWLSLDPALPFEMLNSDWLSPDPAPPYIREPQAHQSSVVL